jgi:hypothetical protein
MPLLIALFIRKTSQSSLACTKTLVIVFHTKYQVSLVHFVICHYIHLAFAFNAKHQVSAFHTLSSVWGCYEVSLCVHDLYANARQICQVSLAFHTLDKCMRLQWSFSMCTSSIGKFKVLHMQCIINDIIK